MPDHPVQQVSADRPTMALWLVISWLWVGVPLAWGVSQTVLKSLDLFR